MKKGFDLIMAAEISVRANTSDSANLTMTSDYLVINGKHYQVKNGYLYRRETPGSIPVKDILSMEYLMMRSKRMFIIFILFMSLVIFGSVGVGKVLTVTKQVDKKVQKVEMFYNYIAEEDSDINITDTVKTGFTKAGVVILYVLLILGSIISFFCYIFRPFRILYISALGATIAVENKYYDKNGLDALIMTWKRGNTNVL